MKSVHSSGQEEEDAYDKIVEGRMNIGDRLYMKDVTDHGPYFPNSVDDALRDPRANHDAAKIRLREDEAVAEELGSFQTCNPPCVLSSKDGVKFKSILKRKKDAEVKPSKRVRFDTIFKDYEEVSEKFQDTLMGPSSTGTKAEVDDSVFVENERRVPDYVLNPSKYTRYSFYSSCEVHDESDGQACMDFLEHIKRSKPILSEQKLDNSFADLPKSVVFIPRKNSSDVKPVYTSSEGNLKPSFAQGGSAVGVTAAEIEQGVVCTMQEDEPRVGTAVTRASFQKQGRRYRTKMVLEEDVS